MSLFERVREVARRAPAARAISAGQRFLTYGDLLESAERRAEELAREGTGWIGLDGGDAPGFLIDFLAAGLSGRAAVAQSQATPPAVRALREARLAEHPPLPGTTVFYSSGSVGPSRAVPLSAENLEAAARAFESWGEVTADDRLAVGLSPAQIFGFVRGGLNPLAVGAEAIYFSPHRDPLEEAARLGGTKVLLPSALVRLAARHASRPKLHALFCGGGAPDPGAAEAVETVRGVPVRSGYGMTEAAGLASRQPLARPRRSGSAGIPAPGVGVVIAGEDGRLRTDGESGEIRLSGPAVFSGYLSPEDGSPFDAAGRLRTGDVGFFDEDGELRVRGRLAFALAAGDRILCVEEIEAALAEHPSVSEAAAAPLERDYGVLVVFNSGALEMDALRAFAEKRLPIFARPRRILAVPALPRTPAGKIDRAAAARWLTESTFAV
jgi:acyl-CoA synthetase (AMP-forming)/AMP-acid ligase II